MHMIEFYPKSKYIHTWCTLPDQIVSICRVVRAPDFRPDWPSYR